MCPTDLFQDRYPKCQLTRNPNIQSTREAADDPSKEDEDKRLRTHTRSHIRPSGDKKSAALLTGVWKCAMTNEQLFGDAFWLINRTEIKEQPARRF